MLWDPMNAWPKGRRWLWVILAAYSHVYSRDRVFSGTFGRAMAKGWIFFRDGPRQRITKSGLPIYTDLGDSVERYLGWRMPAGPMTLQVNGHPPASVLLVLPLGMVNYQDAVLIWNLVSLAALAGSIWLVGRELRIRVSLWSLAPMVALVLLCAPLSSQLYHGQWNLVILLMVTGVWIAARRDRPSWAGGLLGLATAIKLFPGFLFLYFVLRRDWRSVFAGLIAFLVVNGVTAALFGSETYRAYVVEVAPGLNRFQGYWNNASLPGLATKLFNPAPCSDSRPSAKPRA